MTARSNRWTAAVVLTAWLGASPLSDTAAAGTPPGDGTIVNDVQCSGPFHATAGELPGDGQPATVAGVELPLGRTLPGGAGWTTDEPIDHPYQVWATLVAAYADTGLWPMLLSRPYNPDLWAPPAPGDPDTIDAETVLRQRHERLLSFMTDHEVTDYYGDTPTEFPGLLPSQDTCTGNALKHYGSSRRSDTPSLLVLAAVDRPADAPAAIGWNPTQLDNDEVTAILRSWEDRVGLVLVTIDDIGLADVYVERPPTTAADITTWAIELDSFGGITFADRLSDIKDAVRRQPNSIGLSWQ